MPDDKWFVRANRNKTEVNIPCPPQYATTVSIGPIYKELPFKPAKEVARDVKQNLIAHGWKNVRTVMVTTA